MSDILTAQQLKDIALARLAEAKVLLAVRTGDEGIALYDGASYLAGYAVETALKAVICKLLGTDYPPQGATSKPSNEISKAYKTH